MSIRIGGFNPAYLPTRKQNPSGGSSSEELPCKDSNKPVTPEDYRRLIAGINIKPGNPRIK
ncbi:MAG TPA: hypothetical protein PKI94_02050 [Candidatus Gastranaerophilaceae bacterium]|nr:hypothetical protein [Candidatus Gastranaerophilaceae bacterium]